AGVAGVGLSRAVDRAAELCADLREVAIVQADLLDLPVGERAFDLVYSIGVLHHTPDPRIAFGQIARRVKPGGRLAVWLYRRNTAPQEWINTGIRGLTTRLPVRALEPLCTGLGALGIAPPPTPTPPTLPNFPIPPHLTP